MFDKTADSVVEVLLETRMKRTRVTGDAGNPTVDDIEKLPFCSLAAWNRDGWVTLIDSHRLGELGDS